MATSNTPVGSAPALIFAPQAMAQNLIVNNMGRTTAFLGQTGVTAATGFPLEPGQEISLPDVNYSIYAVSGLNNVVSPTNTLSADATLGATALAVASGGASFTNGMVVSIQDGNNSELVVVGAGSTGTSVVVAATTKAHSTGVTFGQFSTRSGTSISVTSGV
jgi:hypothetical protein